MRTYINHTLKLVMGLGLIAGLSGCDKDRGPSVEDHFLNYEIPNVELTADCPVGAFYYQRGNLDDGKLARLAQPWDQSKGQLDIDRTNEFRCQKSRIGRAIPTTSRLGDTR